MSDKNVEYEIKLKDSISKKLKGITDDTNKMEASFSKAGKGIGTFAIAAGVAFVALSKKALETTARIQSLNTAIKFSSGDSLHAGINLQFLRDTADALGITYEVLAESFKTFSGAMRSSKFTQSQQRDMFEKLTKGAKTLGLSGEQTQGMFLALGQIMSKGKVQAEELVGQLGERIPGALSIASRAMGVTTKELYKMMEQGKLMANDFLPKFANQIEKEMAGGLSSATDSISSDLARLSDSWTRFFDNIGKKIASSGIVEKLAKIGYALADMAGNNLNWFIKSKGFDPKSLSNDAKRSFEALMLTEAEANRSLEKLEDNFEKSGNKQQWVDAMIAQKKQDLNKLVMQNAKFWQEWNKSVPDNLKGSDHATLLGMKAGGFDIMKDIKLMEQIIKGIQGFDTSVQANASVDGSQVDKELKKSLGVTLTAASPKTININIAKQVGIENLNTATINESYGAVTESIEKALLRGLAQAEQVSQ